MIFGWLSRECIHSSRNIWWWWYKLTASSLYTLSATDTPLVLHVAWVKREAREGKCAVGERHR